MKGESQLSSLFIRFCTLTNNTTPASYPYAVGHWFITLLSQRPSELEQLVMLSGTVMNFIKSLTLNAIVCGGVED